MVILIADDHAMVRTGLALMVRDVLEAGVIEVGALEPALAHFASNPEIGLALIDLNMPGMAGVETLRSIRAAHPAIKLIVVSGSDSRADMLGALTAGVHGYILKSMSPEEMTQGLATVLAGGIFVPPALSEVPSGPQAGASGEGGRPAPSLDRLTERQREVLVHLAKGRATKEIARTLDLAEGTVKVHLGALYRVLGARSRSEAVALAAKLIT